MKIYKFGGASVRDSAGVKNLVRVVKLDGPREKLVVVSAMDKTTNALEVLVRDYSSGADWSDSFNRIKKFHQDVLQNLFTEREDPVFEKIKVLFLELDNFLSHNRSTNYDFIYDQVVPYGELLSTTIISEYFRWSRIENDWLDARNCICTDSSYREAQVDWKKTQQQIKNLVHPRKLTITQGFVAADAHNFSTTLGREGSDYSAGIFAYCLDGESVSIWKDVPGVLNADPRVFKDPILLKQISYEEAIELAFYGASVIHPKTLQPLKKKEIPLFVRSFLNPEDPGTVVKNGLSVVPRIPCFILKKDLILISLSSLDFSFIVEHHISHIFGLFHKYQIKVDLIQNSAISFSVCVDNKFGKFVELIHELKSMFRVTYNKKVSLYTIRHFDDAAIHELEKGKKILLKQTTRESIQIVTSL